MRRTLTVVLLSVSLTTVVCAQRRGGVSRGGGGPVATRSGHSSFGSHGPAFRGSTGFRGGPVAIGSAPTFRSRGAVPFRSGGLVVRGGIGFGGHRGGGVFIHTRPFHHPRGFSVYPYRYSSAYVYPYIAYPVYPLSYYDAYDYAAVPVQPAYDYQYEYAAGGDNYPAEVGLAEQMRQQNVGVYAQPRAATPQPAPQSQPQATPQPDRAMPPTVLIYRDGKRAEVRNYAIVGQTLWTFNERQAQKVALDQLDLDATRKANEERGLEFAVPQ